MTRPRQERRAHKRLELACPVVLTDGQGRELFQARTLNLSDGGAFLPSRADEILQPGQPVGLTLRVPRSTPNTYMLEEFRTDAYVLRCQDASQKREVSAGLAVRFVEPLNLQLEV